MRKGTESGPRRLDCGRLADMAAHSLLLKLHERDLITLPPCQRANPNRMRHRRLECVSLDRRPVAGGLRSLGALQLHEVSADPERRAVFETLLAREHYLGYRSAVGDYAPKRIMLSCGSNQDFSLAGEGVRERWRGLEDPLVPSLAIKRVALFCAHVRRRIAANHLGIILEDFARDLHHAGYSRSTIREYLRGAAHFADWWGRCRRSAPAAVGMERGTTGGGSGQLGLGPG
jgi:hypothetical protein